MINDNSVKAVNQSIFDDVFCKPLYETYGFSQIPATIKGLFCGQQANKGLPLDTLIDSQRIYERVIVLFIDGFGWRFLQNYLHQFPFLKRFLEKGVISKITSQFPSTTVAHLTCMHTGQSVGQSGLYEWYYYEPLVDAVICPLRFTYAKNAQPLKELAAKKIFSFPTLYEELKGGGVSSHIFYHHSYASSPFSLETSRGATIYAYESLTDALSQLNQKVELNSKGYFFLYLSQIDSVCHQYGPDSIELETIIRTYFADLELILGTHPLFSDPKTAVVLIADHGQTATNPTETFYVNLKIPEVIPYLMQNKNGELLIPAGSPRDFFLHVKQESLEVAFLLLTQKLAGIARVYYTNTLIEQGLFGPLPLSSIFLNRVGNITILPLEGQSVYWYEENSIENHFYGNHGGLGRDEMETIFMIVDQ